MGIIIVVVVVKTVKSKGLPTYDGQP